MTEHGEPRWRVFISHTAELRQYPRDGSYIAAVERAISQTGHVIVDMADFSSADAPPAEECIRRVRECDVYIGVLGARYGSPVPDRPELSYNELEYETATQAGIPRLMFAIDMDADNLGIPLRELIDRQYGDRQDVFRDRLTGMAQRFRSPDHLSQLVGKSLRDLEPRLRIRNLRERLRLQFEARHWQEVLDLDAEIKKIFPAFSDREGFAARARLELLYQEARKVEASHGLRAAVKIYENILTMDENFRDVSSRLAAASALQKNSPVHGYDVFIGHAGGDLATARELYHLLKPHMRTFLDKECILPGDRWDTTILKALQNSAIIVILISPRGDEAFYHGEEIARAISLTRKRPASHRVVPVYLEEAPDLDIPFGLERIEGLHVSESMPLEAVADRLINLHKIHLATSPNLSNKNIPSPVKPHPNSLMHLLDEIPDLQEMAKEYNIIRDERDTPERRSRQHELMNRMIDFSRQVPSSSALKKLALQCILAPGDARGDESRGVRLAGYALLHAHADADSVGTLAQAAVTESAPFGEVSGLRALERHAIKYPEAFNQETREILKKRYKNLPSGHRKSVMKTIASELRINLG